MRQKGRNYRVLFSLAASLLLLGQWRCATLESPRKAYHKAIARQEVYDALIVPGVPFDSVTWSNTMRARVLWSWLLYRNGRVKNIIYSGSAVYSPYYEAKIMGLYAQQLGIPAAHIYYDTLAEHSTENVYYSYELARKLGFKSIALGTEYDQAILLKRFMCHRFGTRIKIFPVYEAMLDGEKMPEPVIDPAPARKPGFRSLPDRESFGQRLGGTAGSKVPIPKHKPRRFPPL
ncbi:YdcF family protein [Taibaiella koreensis]|uniref:YdcF family protein n=1 Tax=Taibaiella koreensis TaxID=1268548 RepID=UPI000E59C90C|nr:YdcF family protein [Taibaiella koreensis]